MYCKKCGTELKEGQRFCPKCGTPYTYINSEEKLPSSSDDIERPSIFPKVLSVIIILVALIGIGFWYLKKPALDGVVDVSLHGLAHVVLQPVPLRMVNGVC